MHRVGLQNRPSLALRCAIAVCHAPRLNRRVLGRLRAESGRFDADASRGMQIEASRYLAQLLDAPDPEKKAEELADKLTENFFMIGSTYLEMAKRESQPAVVEKLKSVLKIAMKARNKTLRPEIQVRSG